MQVLRQVRATCHSMPNRFLGIFQPLSVRIRPATVLLESSWCDCHRCLCVGRAAAADSSGYHFSRHNWLARRGPCAPPVDIRSPTEASVTSPNCFCWQRQIQGDDSRNNSDIFQTQGRSEFSMYVCMFVVVDKDATVVTGENIFVPVLTRSHAK